ncbi:MAG: HlyD family efflux transporter periplasmic adaptor subunit [Acidobacteria bacterium]|nr:HlyD family efflux transporter periplasmic adaptor subunit [Acidobacteriota bacterium]
MDEPIGADVRRRRTRRRVAVIGGAALVLVAATYALGSIQASVPTVDRAGLWIERVQAGSMVLEVRGVGELVPDDFLWLAAETDGRVERVLLRGGALVAPDTVILELSDPETEQAAVAAALALQAAEAAYASLEADLRNETLQLRVLAATTEATLEQADMQATVDATLASEGLLATLTSDLSAVRARALARQLALERQRLETSETSLADRLAVQRSEIERLRADLRVRQGDVDALRVRAGMDGVLQEVVVDEGQRVLRGVNLARVADPARLKAELRIPETQTTGLQVGLPAVVDTRNDVVAGQVSRVDPAAQNGTVTIDVALEGPLPASARPQITVEGIIEVERLDDVLYVGRPTISQASDSISVFRVSADRTQAVRTQVRIGRTSATTVEVLGGLAAGDEIILSDTSAWDEWDVIELR